jgi:putative transposase
MEELQFFDATQDFTVAWKTLPHWAQSGTLTFITWRTADSLPAAAELRMTRERAELLRILTPAANTNWQHTLSKLSPKERAQTQWKLFGILDRELDHNFGECLLARPECSQIVLDSLLHFDDDRYVLTDAVVMPNHVHILVAFRDEDALLAQCESWKRFTARQIQQTLNRRGEFWQVEQFDHLVRGPEQFEYFRRYIADNPNKAKLKPGGYRRYSKSPT